MRYLLLLSAALALAAALPPARGDGEGSGGAPAGPRIRPGDGVTAVIGLEGKRVLPGFVAPDAEPVGFPPGSPKPGSLFRDAVDPFSRMHELALGSGVTSYFVTNMQGRGFLSTQTAVLRPAAGDASRMVLKEPAAVWVNFARGAATERLGFEDQLRAAARYLRDADEARRAGREPPKPSLPGEILAAVKREIPVRVPASLKEEILDALRLAETHGVRLVLEDATEAWLVPDQIARQGAVAVVTPREKRRDPRRGDEPHGGNIAVAAILEKAGTRFCILPVGGASQPGYGFRLGGLAGRDLTNYPIEGAYAIRGGAGEAAVLRALTLGAAEALGVADRIGSIDPGKDADLIVLDGDPFHYRTVVDMALVEGKVLYERSKSSFFRDLPGR